MTFIRKLFPLLFLLFSGHFLLAQGAITISRAPDLKIEGGVTPVQLSQINKTVQTALNDYASAAKLLDPNEKRVTEASIDQFHLLFTPNAMIVKDYAEFVPSNLISYKDYSLDVYNNLKLKGVEMIIQSAELVEVKSDGLGFFIPVVKVRKKIFNTLSADGTKNTVTSGNNYVQKITFDIFKDDMNRANISKIEPNEGIEVPDEYTRIIGISVGLGSSAYSSSYSDYWNSAHEKNNSGLEVKGKLNFSFGAELTTDRFITSKTNPNRQLALSLGLRYASYQMETALRSFRLDTFRTTATANNITDDYLRKVGPVYADEKMDFGVLEIPLGVAYRVWKKQNSIIYLHARLIPGFVISGKTTLSGDALYDGFLLDENGNGTDMRILRMMAADEKLLFVDNGFGPFDVGEQTLDLSVEPELVGLTFAFQLSPTAYLSFSEDNPGWGLMLGVDLGYHFGSFLTHNPVSSITDDAFKFSDDYKASLLSYYTNRVTGFDFGLRIGLFQRLNVEP